MLSAQRMLEKFQQMFSCEEKTLQLHEPQFCGNEWNYVKECLDTGWVSSVGKFVDKFERDLADYTGARYAVATTNGTAALHISYLLAGVKPNEEVLVPTMTFVGTINPLVYCGAIPHFIDAEENHLGIDYVVLNDYLREIVKSKEGRTVNKYTGRFISALCIMHTYGHPVDLEPIEDLCRKYHLVLLEDAAEALGSYYKGVHVGHRGLLGALSFNGNKVITTGGGGAILTNDSTLAKQAKHITTTAKLPHVCEFHHDRVAYNYRLPNINAALGCAQLEKLPEFLRLKRILANEYARVFAEVKEITVVEEPHYAKSNYWLNAILVSKAMESKRDQLLEIFCKNNIMVRPLWELQHTQLMFKDYPCMPISVANSLHKRLIALPSSAELVNKLRHKFEETV